MQVAVVISEGGSLPYVHTPSRRDVQIARELRDLAGRFMACKGPHELDVLMLRVGMVTSKARQGVIAEALLHAAERVEGRRNQGIA